MKQTAASQKSSALSQPMCTTLLNQMLHFGTMMQPSLTLSLGLSALNDAKQLTEFVITSSWQGYQLYLCSFQCFKSHCNGLFTRRIATDKNDVSSSVGTFFGTFCCMHTTIKQHAELPMCSVLSTNALLVSFCMCQCARMIFNCQVFVLFCFV